MEPALQKTKKLFIKPEIAIVNLRPWQPANAMHTQEATKGAGMQHEFVILKIKYFHQVVLESRQFIFSWRRVVYEY